jgi:hypothetical protein
MRRRSGQLRDETARADARRPTFSHAAPSSAIPTGSLPLVGIVAWTVNQWTKVGAIATVVAAVIALWALAYQIGSGRKRPRLLGSKPEASDPVARSLRRGVEAEESLTPIAAPVSPSFSHALGGGQQQRTERGASRHVVDVSPEYLVGLFDDQTSLQAQKLADAFLGKWMVVTGALGDLAGFGDAGWQMVFARTFPEVTIYMWFQDREYVEERLAVLTKGTCVTVLGQIDRIRSTDLQLTVCELVPPAPTAEPNAAVEPGPRPSIGQRPPTDIRPDGGGGTKPSSIS